MEPIILTKENYKDYLNQDVIAFSFSSAGSQGDKCAINIINRKGCLFYANYGTSIDLDNVIQVCPPLKTFKVSFFQSGNENEEWHSIYLGGGNYLQIHSSVSDDFKSEIERRKEIDKFFFLYTEWIDVVISISKPN